jgi:LmbE family N-acetylglucosaminyl deacetylase
MKNKVLVVAAHPDDEILGCGGTIARMVNEGAEAFTLILGEGATSRDTERNRDKRNNEISILKENIKESNKIIGVKETVSYDFPDNRFDTVALLDIVKVIEVVKNQFKPSIIFTHFANDMNIDHYITNKAVLTATRPMPDEVVKEIYAFEVLSSTEWSFPLSFLPDYFVSVTDTLEKKINAMKIYENELRDYPHPRSIKAIELNAEYWGMRTGLGYAESFKVLRINR